MQGRNQFGQQIGRNGVDHPHAERPGQRITPGGGDFFETNSLLKNPSCLGNDSLTHGGNPNLGRGPFEEGRAKLALHLLQRHG